MLGMFDERKREEKKKGVQFQSRLDGEIRKSIVVGVRKRKSIDQSKKGDKGVCVVGRAKEKKRKKRDRERQRRAAGYIVGYLVSAKSWNLSAVERNSRKSSSSLILIMTFAPASGSR